MIKHMFPIVAMAAATLQLVGCGASTMSARVTDAVDTINTLNASAEKPTTEDMKDCKGVVIMHTAQGGLGIGGEGGGGVVMKAIGRGWGAPFAMDVAAGTIGLQIGGQSKHFLIVFYDESALNQFVQGGMQLQAVGEGTGGTSTGDTRSRSTLYKPFIAGSGLYGGLQLGGLNFTPATKVNGAAYDSATATEILDGKVTKPENLSSLTKALDALR
jgi:lipid-binding SYLF domain-containing protein